LHHAPVEVYTAYSTSGATGGSASFGHEVAEAMLKLFPSGNSRLDEETSRLFAMLELDDPTLPRKVASFWTAQSSATQDGHYLVVFARLLASHDSVVTSQVANALLGLHRKLGGREQRTKQTWADRLGELCTELLRRDPLLADALLGHPDFVNPAHVV